MKLIDRHPCEGTQPAIYIGHREYPKPGGRVHVSGTWYAEYCVNGLHRYEAMRTTNKQVAIRKAHDICRRIAAGESQPKLFKLSVEQLKTLYLETKRNEGRPATTLGKYTYSLGLLCDWAKEVGKSNAVAFGQREFWAFNKWLVDAGDSDSTRYDRLILVKQAFKWAHQQKLLPENPLYGIKLAEPQAEEQPCFTAEQVGRLLAMADPHEAAIYAAMAYLGVRFGEARDLKWTDILWDVGTHGFVVIRRGGSGAKTKNKKVRRIPLHPMLKPYLLALPRKSERVFTGRR